VLNDRVGKIGFTPDDLRSLCKKVKDRGAPATAFHVRDIIKQIYGFARTNGAKVANPADEVGPASIATFTPKDRALTPSEIRIAFGLVEEVPTLPTIRLGLKLILLTMVRKSELIDGVWDEVDFEHSVWSIPKESSAVTCFRNGPTSSKPGSTARTGHRSFIHLRCS
jgi:integrase